MQYTWQLALVLMPVYFIKHSISCYIYYIQFAAQRKLCAYNHIIVCFLLSRSTLSCSAAVCSSAMSQSR